MPVLPLRESMGSPPSSEEIWEALSCINAGRAAGKNSLLPELLKCCEADLLEYIMIVWEEGKVPEEWRDALLVPVPKKGDLTQCDNWRGISLLDTMGKLFDKVLQRRLQEMAEGVLSDSQCGFRSGRGCVDLIFSARQLLEKTIEHQSKLFMLFVDLRKAYDSVPRCALWKILEQYGVPEVMIGLLRSLHDGMEAEVTIGGCTSATFSVTNGLRQGCTIAPTLFALYLNRVIECWWGRCKSLGVKVFYKYGGKLVGERTRKPLSFEITELLFADDGVMVCCTRKDMEEAARVFDEVAAEFGLTVSVIKTKLLVVGCDLEEEDLAPLYIRGQLVEQVQSFKYLGSFVETSGSVLLDVQDKIGRASWVFGALRSAVFCDGSLSLSTKRMVYCSMVLGVLLYGAKSWAIKERTIRKIESCHNRCMRCILGVSRADQRIRHLTSEQIRAMFWNGDIYEGSIIY